MSDNVTFKNWFSQGGSDYARYRPEYPSALGHYLASPAENLPDDFTGFTLVTVAQAAHWFNLEAFYREVRRVGAPGSILALISYGVLRLDADLQARFQTFYYDEIGPFWPAESRLVDEGYRTLPFPFDEHGDSQRDAGENRGALAVIPRQLP